MTVPEIYSELEKDVDLPTKQTLLKHEAKELFLVVKVVDQKKLKKKKQ